MIAGEESAEGVAAAADGAAEDGVGLLAVDEALSSARLSSGATVADTVRESRQVQSNELHTALCDLIVSTLHYS